MECSGTSPSAGSANVVSNAEEEVRSLSNEVRDLKIRVGQQEKIIANLKNQEQNINNRLRAQERYSRTVLHRRGTLGRTVYTCTGEVL